MKGLTHLFLGQMLSILWAGGVAYAIQLVNQRVLVVRESEAQADSLLRRSGPDTGKAVRDNLTFLKHVEACTRPGGGKSETEV